MTSRDFDEADVDALTQHGASLAFAAADRLHAVSSTILTLVTVLDARGLAA